MGFAIVVVVFDSSEVTGRDRTKTDIMCNMAVGLVDTALASEAKRRGSSPSCVKIFHIPTYALDKMVSFFMIYSDTKKRAIYKPNDESFKTFDKFQHNEIFQTFHGNHQKIF